MSLKAGFTLFYVGFLSFFIFITLNMGVTVLNIDTTSLNAISAAVPDTGNPILDFFEIIINTLNFFVTAFGIFIRVAATPPFAFLSIIFVPLTVVMVYIIVEVVRGIG